MKKFTEEELLELVYECCVESETLKEYNKKLEELSEQTNKKPKYLDELLIIYFEELPIEKQTKIKQARKRHKESKMTYIKFVERIISMTEEELLSFLKTAKTNEIASFFERYLKKTTDIDLANKAKEKYEEIKIILEEQRTKRKNTIKQDLYEKATSLFEIMIKRGFFCFLQFKRECYKEFGISEDELEKIIVNAKNLLKNKYPDEYKELEKQMEKNRILTFENKKDEITRMLSLIPDNYDIVDYYINIQMDIDIFSRLCKGLITEEARIKARKFFSKYIDMINYSIKYPLWARITSESIINNEILTLEEQEIILQFMKEYRIPNNYFTMVLEKYRKGTLEIGKQKRIK